MALVFCDGFHLSFTSDSVMPAGIWTSAVRSTISSGYYLGTDSAVKRTGRASLRMAKPQTGGSQYLALSLPESLSSLFIGVALQVSSATAAGYFSGNIPLLTLHNIAGTTQLTICFNVPASVIVVYRGTADAGTIIATGSEVLSRDTWYYLEFKIVHHSTEGIFQSKVNGNLDIDFAGNTNTGSVVSVRLGAIGQGLTIHSGSGTYYFDDFVLLDTSGSFANGWPGQPTIHWIAPQGPGEYNQWAVTGAATAWEAIDDWVANGHADDVTTRIDGVEVGDKTSIALSDLPVSGGCLGLQVVTRAANQSPGADPVKLFLRLNNGDYAKDQWIAGTSYNARLTLVHESPATTQPWTKAEIDALEVGYEVVSE